MTDKTEVPSLDVHYAISTGALHTAVQYAEISLRVALESEWTDNKHYLRREMQDVLEMLQDALRRHKERNDAQDAKFAARRAS